MTHVFGAEEAGVKIMTRCQVLAVVKDDVWRVETTQGLMRAVCVINCAGNFGDELEKMRGKVRTKVNFSHFNFFISSDIQLCHQTWEGGVSCA